MYTYALENYVKYILYWGTILSNIFRYDFVYTNKP